MECAFGTIGLLALSVTTFAACGVALALTVIPQIREQRRSHERVAFLRLRLLYYLDMLPQYLQERDRALSIEQRDVLDEFCALAQHASLLEMEEWTSVLRTQATLMTARNRPAFTKREARLAQQSVDQALAALRSHLAAPVMRRGAWWTYLVSRGSLRPSRIRPSMNQPITLRDT